MTILQKVTKETNSCQFGVVRFSLARHSLIVFAPRSTSRDTSSRSGFAFNPAVEHGRRSCGSPPKLRIRKCVSCGKRAAVPEILHASNSSCAVALPQDLIAARLLQRDFGNLDQGRADDGIDPNRPFTGLIANWSFNNRSHYFIAHDYVGNIQNTIEPNGLLLTLDWQVASPML
jgi:hypothetical protein